MRKYSLLIFIFSFFMIQSIYATDDAASRLEKLLTGSPFQANFSQNQDGKNRAGQKKPR